MNNKLIGIVITVLGIGCSLFALLMDYIRGVVIHFGLSQVLVLVLGIVVTCIGILISSGNIKINFSRLEKIINSTIKLVSQGFSTVNKVFPYKIVFPVLVSILIAYSLINPIKFTFNYLTYPYPFEYRDAAAIDAAQAMSRGINIYSLDSFPEHIYLYGLLYPALLSVFINQANHPILIAKFIEFIFLVLFLGSSYYIFRKQKASVLSSIIGIVILLNSTCFLWKLDGVRPDLIGLFFALFCFTTLLNGRLDTKKTLLMAFLCAISFYFKQYMLFSAGVMAVYLFLFISKKKGIIFISSLGIIILLSMLIVIALYPLYYEYSIIHHVIVAGDDPSFLVKQLKAFINYYWVLLVVLFLSLFKELILTFIKRKVKPTFNFLNLDKPLISGLQINPFSIGVIIAVLILVLFLGKHPNNYYTYFGELLLPFLLYLIIPKIDTLFRAEWARYPIQAAVIIFCILPFHHNYSTNFNLHRNAFVQLTTLADQCSYIYDHSPLMAVYKIEREMFPIYDNGLTEYAHTVIPEGNSFFGELSSVPTVSLHQKLNAWNSTIDSAIEEKKFDCIFADSEFDEFNDYHTLTTVNNVWRTLGVTVLVPNTP